MKISEPWIKKIRFVGLGSIITEKMGKGGDQLERCFYLHLFLVMMSDNFSKKIIFQSKTLLKVPMNFLCSAILFHKMLYISERLCRFKIFYDYAAFIKYGLALDRVIPFVKLLNLKEKCSSIRNYCQIDPFDWLEIIPLES